MEEKNRQNTESIRDIVVKIENKDIVLPEFQRDFVWDISKTYDLFDSLVKEIFIGSIIYGIPSFEITVRDIDTRERKVSGKRRKKLTTTSLTKEQIEKKVDIGNFRLVLDGQQRITSIYRAIKGFDNVWFISKNENELSEDIQEKDFIELTLEEIEYEFNGYEDETRLSVKLSDVYEFMEKGYFESEIREKYFIKLKLVQNLNMEEIDRFFRKYLIICRKLQDLFKAQKLLSYFLLDMNSEKFALFFERSNSLGVQLNFIDILVAKLYSGFNLRKRIEEFIENTEGKYNFEREIIVRTISYIVSNGKNVDKGYILANLTYMDFNNYWDEVCILYKKVIDFLYDNYFIVSQDWMPYDNMVIPLIFFLKSLPSKDFCQMNEVQKEFIHYWYWASIFSQRYASATNDAIIQDSNYLINIAKNKKITDNNFFKKLTISIECGTDLYSYNKKGSSIYKGVFNLINYHSKGLLDWNNTSKITFNSKLEDHHIFPREYVKSLVVDFEDYSELVDCVANRTLIPKITNIKIGKKSPSHYLKEIQKSNPNLKDCLKSHFIPVETIDNLYDEFFEDFIKERAEMIFSLIKQTVIDKHELMKERHYEPIKRNFGTNIAVFAKYRQKTVEATLNIETKEILYKGAKYSVSKSADIAKKDLTGKEDTSTNGWKFWKYNDGGQERYIDDFR